MILLGFVPPNEGRQRAIPFGELLGTARIIDDSFNLATVSDDPFVPEQPIKVVLGEVRNPVKIEAVEGGTEILPLGKNSPLTQSGLKALQTQFLE
ncbi:hypothetical protein CCP4SC76_5300012 [Gammaproteobacteria bacterium]